MSSTYHPGTNGGRSERDTGRASRRFAYLDLGPLTLKPAKSEVSILRFGVNLDGHSSEIPYRLLEVLNDPCAPCSMLGRGCVLRVPPKQQGWRSVGLAAPFSSTSMVA